MRRNIAILSGGDSPEYDISVKSARQIMSVMDKNKYNTYPVTIRGIVWKALLPDGSEIPVDIRDFSIVRGGKKIKFDYAYIIIHGTPGEDGKIQGYLEIQKVPYNTGGVLSSALTFNKHACKNYLKNFGILTAESILLKSRDEYSEAIIKERVGLPCFVKPNNGGSSFGTSKVNKAEDLEKAVREAFLIDHEVIVESFVKGTELSCGLLKTKKEQLIFPVTEIQPGNEFFDYEAKYTKGKSEEITPATIPEDVHKKCKQIASEIYDYLDCRGIVRIDFILRGNQLFFLELNSIPGMTEASIVPSQIRAMGMEINEMLGKVIDDTMN
jgi:D-alanine-D-alanine ligase